MKTVKIRALSLLLALLMGFSLLPASAAAADPVSINEKNFPDAVFRAYVKENFDADKNGSLSGTEIAAVTEIDVAGKGIASMKGVEIFTSLVYLDCGKNQLTELDVTKNTLLETLRCHWNYDLTALDVTHNKKLKDLVTEHCPLGTLDVTQNTELTHLDCLNNGLKELDVSRNTKLEHLYCHGNSLTKLDVSGNTALEQLCCWGNRMTALDVSRNKELTKLYCDYNELTALDVSKNTKLEFLSCERNQLKTLDINNNPNLIKAVTEGTKTEENEIVYYKYEADEWVFYFLSHDDSMAVIYKDAKPAILTQPEDQTAVSGKTADFIVDAAGYDITYQWYVQKKGSTTWEVLSGQTKTKLTVTAEAEKDGNKYRCEVTNKNGKAASNAATLTVVSKPKITTQPKKASVKAGKKVTFKVKATGGNLTYQWYRQKPGTKKWEKISKATKATYSFKAAKKWNGYKFRCLVKNAAGKTYTKTVKLTVKK